MNIHVGGEAIIMESRWHLMCTKYNIQRLLGPKFLAAMHCNPIINIYALRDQNTGQGGAVWNILPIERHLHAF